MKINDKVIVAFLVTSGILSGPLASKYVSGLSVSEKRAMLEVADSSSTMDTDTSPVALKKAEN